VKTYFDKKGYGFLEADGGESDTFFHIKEVQGREFVRVGEYLEYEIAQGKRGPKAIKLKVVQFK
jgi:CspA family cold shock protein